MKKKKFVKLILHYLIYDYDFLAGSIFVPYVKLKLTCNLVRNEFDSSFESNSNPVSNRTMYTTYIIIFMLSSEEEFEESFFSYFHRH